MLKNTYFDMNFWDDRFSTKEFIYGKEPNHFFKLKLDQLKAGRILIPGEGEGRNAVHAALKGWEVFAFDSSSVGREKALKLSLEKNVLITYDLSDYMSFNTNEKFDAIALIFTHLPSQERKIVHKKYVEMLHPGGSIILQTFSKAQLGLDTGGPKDLDLLFSIDDLQRDFKELSSLDVIEEDAFLSEGKFHRGLARLISLHGIR